MEKCSDDFALGCATGFRAALTTLWYELQGADPVLRTRLIQACSQAIDREVALALPSTCLSDDFLLGLHSALRETQALPTRTASSSPEV